MKLKSVMGLSEAEYRKAKEQVIKESIDILMRARQIAPPELNDDRSLARRVLDASPEEYERLKAELLKGLK